MLAWEPAVLKNPTKRGEEMKRSLTCLGIVILVVLLLAVGVGGGVLLDRQVLLSFDPPSNIPAAAQSDFQLMAEGWNLIQQNYVDQPAVDPQLMTYGALSGMVDSLGDTGHSRFLDPQMVKQEQNYTQGQFEGIGAYVEMKNGQVVIVAPIDNSPAQKAGLKPGDIITKVNGQDISGLPLDQVVSQILGPVGTTVTLTIMDPNTGATRDVTLVRAKITINNVSWAQLPGTTIAQVRIIGFSQGVTDDLKTTLTDIQNQGLTGIILDLRNNPGGLLSEAVSTASQFLSSGNVLLEKNAQGQSTPTPVESGGVATSIPLAVLVNEGTASASEIVAGALQDAKRAELIGETTFGTGTVLNEFSLSDGSAMLLATEEWLTPDGHTIWHNGLVPNVVVALPQGGSPLFPDAEQGMTAAQLQASQDAQLLKALQILTGTPAQ
jgi:carboxyl-terminal processing protease